MRRSPWLLSFAFAAGATAWCSAAALGAGDVNITLPNSGISTISDPNIALRAARSRIEAHDLRGAVITLQRYMINHPEEGGVQNFLGELYVSSGDLVDAESLYKRMLDNYPLSRDVHMALGKLYVIENRPGDAIDQFEQSLPDVDAIYYLVGLHLRKGDLASFREELRRNAQDRPTDMDAQLDAAELFGTLYMPRDSALEFEHALAIDPNSLEALQGLGLAQTAEGANAEALETLSRCLTLDAQNYGCLDAMGNLQIAQRQYDDAAVTLAHAYVLAPEEPEALVSLGRLADARGDWQDAIVKYQRALYVWPYDADAYVDIVFDEEEHGATQAAVDDALRGLTYSQNDSRLHYLLGYLYKIQGRRSMAIAQFIAAEQSLDPFVTQYAKQSAQELQP
ncbi:MAG: tetratricopeptide repeat protein [Candidatus Tyrphobacter sp.]